MKTTDGRLAIYSLTELKLLKKFRYSKVDGGQDGNCCFSPSGKYFLNIEMHKTDLDTALSIYDTSDFSLIKRITQENNICLDLIEYDTQTDNYYMLGFERIRQGKEIVNVQNFVCLWENDKITNPQYITEKEYDFYRHYIRAKILGFTKQSVIEDEYDLDKLKSYNYSLAKLWHYYISKNQK